MSVFPSDMQATSIKSVVLLKGYIHENIMESKQEHITDSRQVVNEVEEIT